MNISWGLRWVACALCAVLLSGCSTAGKRVDKIAVKNIVAGQTTQQDLYEMIGRPWDRIDYHNGKSMLFYYYSEAKSRFINFVPVIGLLKGVVDTYAQWLVVVIDQEGRVEGFSFEEDIAPYHYGLLNQKPSS